MITVEADDHEPQRAADMANAYVEELAQAGRELDRVNQQRRVILQSQLKQVRVKLDAAQARCKAAGSLACHQAWQPPAVEALARLRAG